MPIKCYTVDEIAEILNLTPRQVLNYIKEGLLRGYRGMSKKEGWIIPEGNFLVFCHVMAPKSKEARDFLAGAIDKALHLTEIDIKKDNDIDTTKTDTKNDDKQG